MKTNRIFYSAIVLGTGACSLPHTLMAQQQPHIILIVFVFFFVVVYQPNIEVTP